MTQFRTIDLSARSATGSKPSLRRYGPPADLLSQMLQQRHRAAPGPARAPESLASDAYAYTAKATVLRMPAGYRTTVVA